MEALFGEGSFWIAAGAALVLVAAARLLDQVLHLTIGDGVPVALGALVGLSDAGRLPLALVGALVLLVAAVRLTPSASAVTRVAATLPGAALLGAAVTTNAPTWSRAFAGCAAVALIALAPGFDEQRPRLTGLVFAISAAGLYATVPNTEEARVLLAATLVGAVVGISRGVADPAGVSALVGLICWTAAAGGYARPGAVVGGMACVGVLALAPLLREAPVPLLIVAHVVLVGVSSRGAGLRERAWVAIVIVVGAYAVVVVVTRTAVRRMSRRTAMTDP